MMPGGRKIVADETFSLPLELPDLATISVGSELS
jgi:hypothetical protein